MDRSLKQSLSGTMGLRRKLLVAISLMSVIPLLIIIYLLLGYVATAVSDTFMLYTVSAAVIFTVILAAIGFVVTRRLVEPIIEMANQAREIAGGDLGRRLSVTGEDEIADLGRSINSITQKIREHLSDLQKYSTRTKEVNIDIQKKVLVLSNLLQISDMIAASEKIETICDTVVHKITEIDEDNFAVLFISKPETITMELAASSNVHGKSFKGSTFHIDKDYIGTIVRGKTPLVIDASERVRPQGESLLKVLKATSLLIIPVIVHGNGIGFVAVGNAIDRYEFKEEEVDVVKVLTKQLGIAIEKAELIRLANESGYKDNLTGLYNEKYIKERLDEEIERSILYQRPCSLLLFNVDNFQGFRDSHGELVTEEALKKIASIIAAGGSWVSKAARLGGDEFAVVLPEKNKKEAKELAEDMRKKVESAGARLTEKGERPLTVSGSVSENPIDGASAQELFSRAYEGLKEAKEQGKNRIAA